MSIVDWIALISFLSWGNNHMHWHYILFSEIETPFGKWILIKKRKIKEQNFAWRWNLKISKYCADKMIFTTFYYRKLNEQFWSTKISDGRSSNRRCCRMRVLWIWENQNIRKAPRSVEISTGPASCYNYQNTHEILRRCYS